MEKKSVLIIFLLIISLNSVHAFDFGVGTSFDFPTNGLNDLDDVTLTNPIEAQVILYNESSNTWHNAYLNDSAHHVNASDNWITNIGSLLGVNVTQFLNVAGLLNIDTSWLTSFINQQNSVAWNRSGTNVFLAQTGDNVGIGTTSPGAKLQVDGGIRLTDNPNQQLRLGVAGIVSYIDALSGSTTGEIQFRTGEGNVNAVRIDKDGNVGIGTATPSEPLHIEFTNTDGAISGLFIKNAGTSSSSSYAGIRFQAQNAVVDGTFTVVPESGSVMSGGGALFRTVTSHQIGFSTGNTLRMRLSAAGGLSLGPNYESTDAGSGNMIIEGNVGIGTTSPQNKLNVIGSINQTNGNLTGNLIYGEMWNHSDTGFIVDLVTIMVYANVTNLTDGSNNGFTLSNSKLISQVEGTYHIDYTMSFSGSANSEIGFAVGIGGQEQHQTHSHRKIGTGGDIGNAGGTGIITVNVGDEITLMARDEANPVQDIIVVAANLNLWRIGN